MILDHEGGVPTALAIVDYKTSTKEVGVHDLQLQVYADAGRREGLDVRGAYVHDLKAGARTNADVTPPAVADAETVVPRQPTDYTSATTRPRPARPAPVRGADDLQGGAAVTLRPGQPGHGGDSGGGDPRGR